MESITLNRLMQAVEINEKIEFTPIKAIGNNTDGEYFRGIFDEYDIDDIVYPRKLWLLNYKAI